jgi:hypothetical protein
MVFALRNHPSFAATLRRRICCALDRNESSSRMAGAMRDEEQKMRLAIPAAGLILIGGACLLPFAGHAQDVPPQSASASATVPAATQVVDPARDQSSHISASVSPNHGGGGDDSVVAVAPRTDNVAIHGSTDGDVAK